MLWFIFLLTCQNFSKFLRAIPARSQYSMLQQLTMHTEFLLLINPLINCTYTNVWTRLLAPCTWLLFWPQSQLWTQHTYGSVPSLLLILSTLVGLLPPVLVGRGIAPDYLYGENSARVQGCWGLHTLIRINFNNDTHFCSLTSYIGEYTMAVDK